MIISQAARRNHDALFPNHQLTLKVADPELNAFKVIDEGTAA